MKKNPAHQKPAASGNPKAKKPAPKGAAGLGAQKPLPKVPSAKRGSPPPAEKTSVAPKISTHPMAAPARAAKAAVTAVVKAAMNVVAKATSKVPNSLTPHPAKPPHAFDKSDAEKAAKAILKALKPLLADDDEGDAEAQRNKLSLENAHPRRRHDGHYEVFLRYNAGSGLADPETEAERRARAWFSTQRDFSGIPVAVDVNVLEERES